MNNLPEYIGLTFLLTSVLMVLLFYKASHGSKVTLMVLLLWIIFQSIMGYTGFYEVTDTVPPRFLLIVLPPLLTIIILFVTKRGRMYIDRLHLPTLTLFHVTRIPVELVLFWLLMHKVVPEQMTFEGNNFDILSGISAPFIYYFAFHKKKMSKKIALGWNIICLGLLLNVVITGVLSAPTPFQKIAFDQPNIALLHFPFNLLPALVPLVLFSHLASIRQLWVYREVYLK